MNIIKKIIIVLLITALMAGAGILFYFTMYDDYAVSWVIRGAKKAFEKEDIEMLMSYVADSYSDDYGFDYPMARRLMSNLFKDFDKFDVIMENPVTEIQGDKAIVQLSLWIAVDWKDSLAYIVGTNQAGAAVRIHLSKTALAWKVVKIEGIR